MPRIPSVLLLILTSLLFGGCATTSRPTYNPPASGETATIKGGSANIVRFFSAGEAHVAIIEIDGLVIPPSFWTGNARSVNVTAGPRKVTVLLSGNNYTQAQETIQLDVVAGKTYQIEAHKVGIDFDLSVFEETDKPAERKSVFSARLHGGSSGGPAFVPIFIPVK